ncbi:MAG: hypothetical protein HOV94_16355 [Saccharothrix sp.]|nr:hypothetical protein [Saccharothrix sp.]
MLSPELSRFPTDGEFYRLENPIKLADTDQVVATIDKSPCGSAGDTSAAPRHPVAGRRRPRTRSVTSGQHHVATASPTAVAARLRVLADMIENRGNRGPSEPARLEASKPAPQSVTARSSPQQANPADVRAWAAANGRVVSQRGRLPAALINEFLAENR